MTKRSIAAVALLLVLLTVILAAPYLIMRQQEIRLLRRVTTQTVDQSSFYPEKEPTTLLDRICLSVDPDAAQSWLAQEMVGSRYGHWDGLMSRLRQELTLLMGVSANSIGQYTDLRVIYYYHPTDQRTASFASCLFSGSDGQLSLELDLQDYKITALDFSLATPDGTGVLHTLATLLQSGDWERRWGSYLGLEYQEDGFPEATFRIRGGQKTVTYYRYADGVNFSWRPLEGTP